MSGAMVVITLSYRRPRQHNFQPWNTFLKTHFYSFVNKLKDCTFRLGPLFSFDTSFSYCLWVFFVFFFWFNLGSLWSTYWGKEEKKWIETWIEKKLPSSYRTEGRSPVEPSSQWCMCGCGRHFSNRLCIACFSGSTRWQSDDDIITLNITPVLESRGMQQTAP